MGRRKSAPTRLNNLGENWSLQKPLDYIPKTRSYKKKVTNEGPFYNIMMPSDKNRRFYIGAMLVGNTNNELPDYWRSCRISFLKSQQKQDEHILIKLDSTSVLVKLVCESDLLKEIIKSKIFAIRVFAEAGSIHFDVYFSDLPLPKFNKNVGLCVQTVLWLILGISGHSDRDDTEMDLTNEYAIPQLYKNISEERKKGQNFGWENVQDPKLKPQLRPYQADAVRWMLSRERNSAENTNEINPLYSVIKLKSGLEIYYDKYSGYVELTKPLVGTFTKGGILADEMGLGKTVEVLACILKHPKNSSESCNFENSPTVDHMTKKRKIEETKPVVDSMDQAKKIRVPDNWVKSCSKKSQTYLALEMWYNKILAPSKVTKNNENLVQCICGVTTTTTDKEDTVVCSDCEKIQHGSCLGYKKRFGPYKCPQCWANQPLLESKATLIVSPVSLRTQWCKEICQHVRGDLKVLQYGGSSVTPIYPSELMNYDIVITTYSILQSELRLTENGKDLSLRHQRRYSAPGSPLTRVKWWRLCLDEAQTVETTTSMVSAMAKKLSAHFRWAVTGTPMSKDISDLHGLIDYLQLEPYNDVYTWEQLLYNPYMQGQTGPMLKFLSQVLWRSSKDEVFDQIDIPKQTVEEHWLLFSAIEQYFYRCEHQSNARVFLERAQIYKSDVPLQNLDKSSLKTLLAPLLSLRQICSYPNSVRTRYLATKKPVKSMKDLLNALIAKNVNECEEQLRIVLSTLNGLAGIYLLLHSPEQAVESYRNVLQLNTRFTEEEKVAKLTTDKLQVIHALHNLAETLDVYPTNEKTLRDDVLRKDCAELEKKYIEKFINQSMTALQDCLMISNNITKLRDSFVLEAGRWYSDLLEWIYVHSYDQELYLKIQNFHSTANIECTVDFRNARSLIYALSNWDENISQVREETIQILNDLYIHCPDDEFKIIVSQELVRKATDCHLRPRKSSKNKKKCPFCVANDHLKTYELQLFAMSKRKMSFEEMSLQGSWKPTPQELIFRAVLAIGRAKNVENNLIRDGEIHINILDTIKKEFKELRKLWTHLEQQICAQDELDMCKIRLHLKENDSDKQKKTKLTSILKNLTYNLENKFDTIHLLHEHELEHERVVLHNEAEQKMSTLEKGLGVRNYLETLHKQQHNNQSPDPCPICKNVLEKHWAIVPCGHSYCLECIQSLIDQTKGHHMQCSVCRAYHLASEISYIKNEEEITTSDTMKIIGDYSTKVDAIVKLVLRLKSEDSEVKVLLFSSWVPVLTYIRGALTNNDILTELVSSSSLEKQVEHFKDFKKNITVLLLPIHLGGKGLNLIEATHIILTEPLLNPADELQAIGRVHRIGQTRPTVVHKFFIHNTIEESIYKAVSGDVKNWEKNKVTVGKLIDLFTSDDYVTMDTQL